VSRGDLLAETSSPMPTLPPGRLPLRAAPETAMVFAAGLGTRMRPISDALPKPLIPVGGKPLIDHMLDRLADAGVHKAVVNVHYRADQIEAHLVVRAAPRIVISDERSELLDQGGGIKKALAEFGDAPFFICNTDALWIESARSNLRRFAAAWDPDRMDVFLLVAAAATSIGVDWPGDFTMDAEGRLTRREERLVAPFVYAGVGIVKPQLFAGVAEDVFKLAPFFFAAAERGRLYGLRLDGSWLHVGTPDAIGAAERAIARSRL
jgi:MurNAc alpha-1-phosphate uridylyltransferase